MSIRLMLNFKPNYFIIIPLFVALLLGAESKAASCCAGGGGQSVCVLSSDQTYQFGVAVTTREIAGHYDPYGNYTENGSGISTSSLTTVFGGAYRMGEDWQLGVSLPMVNTQKTYSKVSTDGGGLGDPVVELRYLVWEDLSFLVYKPQLTLYGGVRMPVGKSVYDSKEVTEVDITGDGYTTLHVGANASKLMRPFSFVVDASYYYSMSKNVIEIHSKPVNEYSIQAGNRFQFVESITYLWNEKFSSGLGSKQSLQFESTLNGNSNAGSASRNFSTLASLSYFSSSITSFSLNFETLSFFEQYTVNQPQSQAVSLAMSYSGL